MARYLYTVWFRDELAQESDQDREWPACFLVEGDSARDAQRWGDHLAHGFSTRRETETFLRSEIEECIDSPLDTLPCVMVGHQAPDAELGW